MLSAIAQIKDKVACLGILFWYPTHKSIYCIQDGGNAKSNPIK